MTDSHSCQTTTVLIADYHAQVRRVLTMLLNSYSDVHVVAEASSTDEVLKQCEQHQPDIALIDLAMPKGGIATIRLIRSLYPQIKVIAINPYMSESFRNLALSAGAAYYVSKQNVINDLIACIRGTYP